LTVASRGGRILAGAAVLLAVAAGLFGWKLAGGGAKGKLAIGVLAPLSGSVSGRGHDLVDGAKLAADELNP
jgi:branched-chain amino acid transport system substrate-binding protein